MNRRALAVPVALIIALAAIVEMVALPSQVGPYRPSPVRLIPPEDVTKPELAPTAFRFPADYLHASRDFLRPALVAVGVKAIRPIGQDTAPTSAPTAVPSASAPTATTTSTDPVLDPPAPVAKQSARATGSQPTPAAPAEGTGKFPTPAQWARLRMCESSDNYADKYNALYRGAYQIGWREWHTDLGLTGDPADAPPAVQDAAALRLWQARGWTPWYSSSHCSGLR